MNKHRIILQTLVGFGKELSFFQVVGTYDEVLLSSTGQTLDHSPSRTWALHRVQVDPATESLAALLVQLHGCIYEGRGAAWSRR